jgi:hypothetical protein
LIQRNGVAGVQRLPLARLQLQIAITEQGADLDLGAGVLCQRVVGGELHPHACPAGLDLGDLADIDASDAHVVALGDASGVWEERCVGGVAQHKDHAKPSHTGEQDSDGDQALHRHLLEVWSLIDRLCLSSMPTIVR